MKSKLSSKVIEYLVKLSRPHVVAEDITQIDYKKMKDMGMEKIIFDKYNTLIRHGEVNFPDASFKESLL